MAGKNLLQGVILFFRHKPAETAAGKIHELLLSGALENAENLFVHRQYLFLFVPGNQKHPAGKIIHPFFAISSILHTPHLHQLGKTRLMQTTPSSKIDYGLHTFYTFSTAKSTGLVL